MQPLDLSAREGPAPESAGDERGLTRALTYAGGVLVGFVAAFTLTGAVGVLAQRPTSGPVVGRAVARVCVDAAAANAGTASTLAVMAAHTNASLPAFVPGEVLFQVRSGTTESELARALGALRSRPLVSDIEWTPDFARLRDRTGADPEVMAAALRMQPEILWAQPNFIRRLAADVPVAAGDAAVLTGAHARPAAGSGRGAAWNLSVIGAEAAWTQIPDGVASPIVAVLDTGLTTEELSATRQVWRGGGFGAVNVLVSPAPGVDATRVHAPRDIAFEPGGPVLDLDGHGTHVAGVIAAGVTGAAGVRGLAPRARVMPVKVCVGYWELMLRNGARGIEGFVPQAAGGCADSDVAAGIRYAADKGAAVINLSMSGSSPSPLLQRAIAAAVARGVFVAAPAELPGSDGSGPSYPGEYAAGIDGFVSVAAVDASLRRSPFTGARTRPEVVAPGGWRTQADRQGTASLVWAASLLPSDSDPLRSSSPRFDRYAVVGRSGASTAVPHVSGLASLAISRGQLSPSAIEAWLTAAARDLGAVGPDAEFGNGLVTWPLVPLVPQGARRFR